MRSSTTEEDDVIDPTEKRPADDDAPIHGGEGDPLGEGVAEADEQDDDD